MTRKTADLLAELEEALNADDWSSDAHNGIEGLVEVLNDREMTDEEYERYSVLLRKF